MRVIRQRFQGTPVEAMASSEPSCDRSDRLPPHPLMLHNSGKRSLAWGDHMARFDDGRQPEEDYLVDRGGQKYGWVPGEGWHPAHELIDDAAVLRRIVTSNPVARDVTGRPLYVDPRISFIPIPHSPVVPQPRGLGAIGILGIVGFLAIIGVAIWLFVAHQGSGYPPSRTLADYYNPAAGRSVNAIAFSPSGKKLVSADADSGANLWNVHRGKLIHVFDVASDATRVAFSSNGRLLAVGDVHGQVYVWNIARRRKVAQFSNPTADVFDSDEVYGLAFSPSGKVYLWNATSGSKFTTLPVTSSGSGGEVGFLAFSPNGRTLAIGDSNGRAYLWSAAQRSKVSTLNYPHASTTGIAGVAFSPNGHILATLQTDGTTVLWNMSTKKAIGTLPTGDSGLDNCSIAFSPTGETLAAGCNRRSTYLWDVSSRKRIATLTGTSGNIDGVAFSPDGKTLAAGSDTGYIYLWDVQKLVGSK
jgi:WD domain, G-beta repeat/Anaphase-promoting complex subunit 4 WD40 domain